MSDLKHRPFTEEEKKWIKKFKRVMKDPSCGNLFMFVDGQITIFPGRIMGSNQGVFQGGATDSVLIPTPMDCDGGDY